MCPSFLLFIASPSFQKWFYIFFLWLVLQIYESWFWVERDTVKVTHSAQEHNSLTRSRLKAGRLDPKPCAFSTRLLRLWYHAHSSTSLLFLGLATKRVTTVYWIWHFRIVFHIAAISDLYGFTKDFIKLCTLTMCCYNTVMNFSLPHIQRLLKCRSELVIRLRFWATTHQVLSNTLLNANPVCTLKR